MNGFMKFIKYVIGYKKYRNILVNSHMPFEVRGDDGILTFDKREYRILKVSAVRLVGDDTKEKYPMPEDVKICRLKESLVRDITHYIEVEKEKEGNNIRYTLKLVVGEPIKRG